MDYNKKHDVNYHQHGLFELFDERLDQFGLIQLVKQDTWSQMVGTTLRSFLLDHVYTGDADCIYKIECSTPCFGDHKLIVAHIRFDRPDPETVIRRDWRNYSKDKLVEHLTGVDWSGNANDVQQFFKIILKIN